MQNLFLRTHENVFYLSIGGIGLVLSLYLAFWYANMVWFGYFLYQWIHHLNAKAKKSDSAKYPQLLVYSKSLPSPIQQDFCIQMFNEDTIKHNPILIKPQSDSVLLNLLHNLISTQLTVMIVSVKT